MRWLLITVVFILAIVDSIFVMALVKPSLMDNVINDTERLVFNVAHGFGIAKPVTGIATPVKPQPLTLPVVAYVVGPPPIH